MRYRFVDCRFDVLDSNAGERLYLDGHIPGAVFMDVDRDLADLTRAPAAGRHPLPDAAACAHVASEAGIEPGVFVIAYDQGMTGGAARLWWLLRHFGHDDVAVLEGGLGAWNGPLVMGSEEAERGAFVARERTDDTIDANELLARSGDGSLTLVDARAASRFRGDESPVDALAPLDPAAGHVPGAVNAPFQDGLPDSLLRATELAVYCGSGVTACIQLLRLARAGRSDARLYPGSWSEWSRRGLPVSRTPEHPGDQS